MRFSRLIPIIAMLALAPPAHAADKILTMDESHLKGFGQGVSGIDASALAAVFSLSPTTLTISSGAIAATGSSHKIDTESAAASDDLDTITATTKGLRVFTLANASHNVVFRDHAVGSGNIYTPNAVSITLDLTTDYVLAFSDGTNVHVIGGRTAAVGGFGYTGNATAAATLTVASGVITRTQMVHKVAGEGAANDDLDTVTGAATDGVVTVLRPSSDSVDIVVKHGTGNIECPGASDITLAEDDDFVVLVGNGTKAAVVAYKTKAADIVAARLGTGAVTSAKILDATIEAADEHYAGRGQIVICGDLTTINNNTVYYGPNTAATATAVGGLTCDTTAAGSATEATADAPVFTGKAFQVRGMVCRNADTNATVSYTLRSAVAGTTPSVTCSVLDNELDCVSAVQTTTAIASGATLAVAAASTANMGTAAFVCVIEIAY